MNKLFIAGLFGSALALSCLFTLGVSNAVGSEYSIDAIVANHYDARLPQNGVRVEGQLNTSDLYVVPFINASWVDDEYTRFGAGASYRLHDGEKLNFDVRGTVIYQDSDNDIQDGWGISPGFYTTYDVNKNVEVFAGYEYNWLDSDINDFDGGVVTSGLSMKF